MGYDERWTAALHEMCRYYKHGNLIEIFKMLIEYGVNFSEMKFDGLTILSRLCRYYINDNWIEIIELLITNGVDVAECTPDG